MIGRGGVFAAVRSQMLRSLPLETKCPFKNSATLGNWLENGSFTVLRSTRQTVTLQANPSDFAVVKLNEVEFFLNHALEHVQELVFYESAPRERSESWVAVTAYYLGFFAAGAILRLVGLPNVFLTRDRLAKLRDMGNSAAFPTAGSFQFQTTDTLSATAIQVELRATEKAHEAAWKAVLGLLNKLKQDKTIVFAANEADFYDSLCSNAFCNSGIGFDWPSDIRNRLNYRPGYSYRLLYPLFRVSDFLKPWKFATGEDVFSILNQTYRRCSANKDSVLCQVEMMLNVSLVLYLLARNLYKELEERRMTDRRWEMQRAAYRRSKGLLKSGFQTFCV